ncbi:unnamed protein product, partial [Prorocentrum cordatum]
RPSLLALARLRVAGAAAAGWPQRPLDSCLAPRRPGEGPARGPGRASTRVAPGGVSAASPPGGGRSEGVGADRRGRPRGGQTAVRQPRGAAGGADLRGAGPGRGACARVRQPLQATPGQRDLPLASCAPATLRRRAELGQERPPEEGGGAGGGGGGPRH